MKSVKVKSFNQVATDNKYSKFRYLFVLTIFMLYITALYFDYDQSKKVSFEFPTPLHEIGYNNLRTDCYGEWLRGIASKENPTSVSDFIVLIISSWKNLVEHFENALNNRFEVMGKYLSHTPVLLIREAENTQINSWISRIISTFQYIFSLIKLAFQ